MALTIHYSFHTATATAVEARSLVSRLRTQALDLPFEQVGELIELGNSDCDYRQLDQEHPHRPLLIQALQYVDNPRVARISRPVAPLHLIAFSAHPGPGCEAACFGLGRYPAVVTLRSVARGKSREVSTGLGNGWHWASICTSQFASNPNFGGLANFLRCHLSVIHLLDRAGRLGILMEVNDDGRFWEERSMEGLSREVDAWNQWAAALAGRLKDRFGRELFAEILQFPNFEHLEAAGQS